MNYTLITGASMGIGLELAWQCAAHGENLVLVARSQNKLDALAAEIISRHRVQVVVIPADLSLPDAAVSIFEACSQKGLHIAHLINNAGFGDYGFFAESNWKKQADMINLNVLALTQFTHLFLPEMLRRKYGRIMQVASTASFQPGPLMSVYFATKSFVLHFSEALFNECEGTGVTVTALCPGATDSGFVAAANLGKSRLVKDKKLPTSAEVAKYGYAAMMAGKRVAIHGFLNSMLARGASLMPRGVVLRVARGLQSPI